MSKHKEISTTAQPVWRRVTSVVTLIAFLFQMGLSTYANANSFASVIGAFIDSAIIESAVNATPEFQRSPNYASHQFNALPYIEASSANGFSSIQTLFDLLEQDHVQTLGDPIFVDGEWSYANPKHIGTPLVQSRLIREQVRELLGRHLIDSELYKSEAVQLWVLYNNAKNYAIANPHLRFGDQLEIGRVASASELPADMIWPQKRLVNDEVVLYPKLYLTEQTVKDRKIEDHSFQLNGVVDFENIDIDGVTVTLGRDSYFQTVEDLRLTNVELNASGNLKLQAGGSLALLSSSVSVANDLNIVAEKFDARTLVHRYEVDGNLYGHFGEVTTLDAGGDIRIRSYSDINLAGVTVNSGDEITFAADGNIVINSVELQTSEEINPSYGGFYAQRSSVDYLVSKISAEDTIEFIANGNIVIDAAEIHSNEGHIEILAGLGITVEDDLAESRAYEKRKFGKTREEISAYKTVAMRAVLDAGKGIRIHSEFGDITMRATDITSVDGTSVKANNGGVNLLMTVETDHYSYSSVKKGSFTIKNKSKGHNIETGVPNTIVGGFAVEALQGLRIEYEGDPTLSLDEQIAELSNFEGLEWMADVRANTTDVDWQAIELKYETWKESNTSLSPAFAAVVSIAVAIVTSGAGAGFAEFVLGSQAAAAGTLGTAIAAGTTSLISQAAVAVGNGIVNGDVGQALEDLASSDTLRNLATTMVTAGVLAELDFDFMKGVSEDNVDGNIFFDAQDELSLIGQTAQVLTRSAVQSGVETAIQGGSFEDSFTNILALNVIDTIGKETANYIGDFSKNNDVPTAIRYIAHAGAGCVVGAANARVGDENTESGCWSGAGGAVIGEAIGDIYNDQNKLDERVEATEKWLKDNDLIDLENLDQLNLTDEQKRALLDSRPENYVSQSEFFKLQQKGVDLARLGAGLSAFALGGDVETAAQTGGNAAEQNALWFLIPVILKGIDLAIEAYDLYVVVKAFEQSDSAGYDALERYIAEKGIEFAISRAIPGGASVEALYKYLEKNGFGNIVQGAKNNLARDKLNIEGPRIGERRISQELFDKLSKKSPTDELRDMVNEGKVPPYSDPVLPGFEVTGRLHADHVVPKDRIAKMEGFDKLTEEQQITVFNNKDNIMGLSEAANKSKGTKSYREWTHHISSGTEVDPAFRERMMRVEQELEIRLQQQIDEFVKINSGG